MVASCHRKTGGYTHSLTHSLTHPLISLSFTLPGNYPLALQCYRDIHQHFPDNIDCLRFLVRLSTDMGLKEAQEYSLLLQKVEKSREAKRQVHCKESTTVYIKTAFSIPLSHSLSLTLSLTLTHSLALFLSLPA